MEVIDNFYNSIDMLQFYFVSFLIIYNIIYFIMIISMYVNKQAFFDRRKLVKNMSIGYLRKGKFMFIIATIFGIAGYVLGMAILFILYAIDKESYEDGEFY